MLFLRISLPSSAKGAPAARECLHGCAGGRGGQGRQGWGWQGWDEDAGLGGQESFISLEDSAEVREVKRAV